LLLKNLQKKTTLMSERKKEESYLDSKSVARHGEFNIFGIKYGVHQGSIPSPTLLHIRWKEVTFSGVPHCMAFVITAGISLFLPCLGRRYSRCFENSLGITAIRLLMLLLYYF